MNKKAICAAALVLSGAASAVQTEAATVYKKMEVVNTTSLNLRKGPSTKYAKLGTVKKGQVLDVISVSNGWAKINHNGKTVYASASYLKTKTATTPVSKKEMVAKVDDLNVRAGSSTKHKILGKLNKGDKVTVISELSNGWVKIEYKGSVGYVSNARGAYLDKVAQSKPEDAPVVKKEMVAKVDDLNVRTGSSTKHKILGKLNKGDRVTVISELSNGWIKVEYNNGIGYVSNVKGAYLVDATVLDKEIAQKVDSLIAELDREITLDDKELVLEANKLFNELPTSSKKLVTKLNILEKALMKISELELGNKKDEANKLEAQKVMDKINELDREIAITDKDAISSVRDFYDRTHADIKKLVTNLDILEKAEKELEKIEEKVNNAISLITSIPQDLDLTHKDEVQKAREAYDALTVDEKKCINDVHIVMLTRAEKYIEQLEKDLLESHKQKAQELVQKITALNEEIDFTHKDSIEEIRRDYNALIEDAKELVTNYDEFVEKESKLDDVLSEINNIKDLIEALPEDIVYSNKAQIEKTREAYDALSVNNKTGISEELLGKLTKAEEKIQELEDSKQDILTNNTEVQGVVSAIENLPEVDNVELSDKEEILGVMARFRALPENVKFAVETEKLEEVFDKVEALMAEDVISDIEDLPEVEFCSLSDEDAIKAARAKYDEISEKNNTLVTNLEKLTQLEEKVAEIKALEGEVNTVLGKITGLDSDIDFTKFASVVAAREAYESLSDEGKALVTSIDLETLVDAEEKMQAISEKIDAVKAEIESLNEDITLDEKAQVDSARNAYNALSSANQTGINADVLEKLTNAEAKIASTQNTINSIIEKIDAIEEDINFTNLKAEKAKIDEINALIETLNRADVHHIGAEKLKKHGEAELVVNRLSKVPEDISAQAVVDLITALPEAQAVEFSDVDKIKHARDCYNALDSDEQQQVTNLDKLIAVEAEFERINQGINALLTAIHQIPELDDLTLDDEPKVTAARALYDSSDEKITYYINHIKGEYSKLVDSEEKIARLKAESSVTPDENEGVTPGGGEDSAKPGVGPDAGTDAGTEDEATAENR